MELVDLVEHLRGRPVDGRGQAERQAAQLLVAESEPDRDRGGVGRSLLGILLEALEDEVTQVLGDVVRQRRGRLVDVAQSRRDRRAAVERAPAREHLVPHDAEGVEVARARGRVTEGLLRADVVRGAQHLAVLRVTAGVEGAGDAEVGELHEAVVAHHDVGRLDVAVHDPGLVRDAERERGLPHDRAHLARRERAALVEDRRERLAGDELHDEEGETLVLAVVEDRGDVGVHQGGRVDGLVAEAEREQALVVGVGTHDLDGDLALQHRVGPGPDVGHPTGGDALVQVVAVAQHEPFMQAVHVSGTRGFRTEGARQLTSQGPSSAVMVRDPGTVECPRVGISAEPAPGCTAPGHIPLHRAPRTGHSGTSRIRARFEVSGGRLTRSCPCVHCPRLVEGLLPAQPGEAQWRRGRFDRGCAGA